MWRGVLLAASLHCARGNAHEPTRAPTTQPPTPRPTMTDRRGGKADEIPVRAAAFAAAGFAALGLIAAAVWHESRVERVGPSSPSLPRGLARKRCGTPRLGWHAWTPRLAQPRAPRGRLLPSCSRVRPTTTITVTTQVPPQGRQEDLRQPTPDAHQGPGFTVSKAGATTSKNSLAIHRLARRHAHGAGERRERESEGENELHDEFRPACSDALFEAGPAFATARDGGAFSASVRV